MCGMLSLIQRVTRASVEVDGQVVGEIGDGLLALVGVEPGDGPDQLRRMVQKLLGYRVFADDAGKMNRSLADIGGGLLLVSQFSTAAPPEEAERVFNQLLQACRQQHPGRVETGRFGAHMVISLVNDGPVTFLLRA